MKTIATAALLLITCLAQSQMYIGMALGRSFGKAETITKQDAYYINKSFNIVTLHAGYQATNGDGDKVWACFEAAMHTPFFGNNSTKATNFGVQAGPVFNLFNQGYNIQLMPHIGYAYSLVSNDQKYLNKQLFTAGIRARHNKIFAGIGYERQSIQIHFGIIGLMKEH